MSRVVVPNVVVLNVAAYSTECRHTECHGAGPIACTGGVAQKAHPHMRKASQL
jgi:hypothetical protein